MPGDTFRIVEPTKTYRPVRRDGLARLGFVALGIVFRVLARHSVRRMLRVPLVAEDLPPVLEDRRYLGVDVPPPPARGIMNAISRRPIRQTLPGR